MSYQQGMVEHTIRVTRVNSRLLKNSKLYLLHDPAGYVKLKYDIFDCSGYFKDLIEREKYVGTTPNIVLAITPRLFCLYYSKFIKHLYIKYGMSLVYYAPKYDNGYYRGNIWGFLFDDPKKRMLFELSYNDLREKHTITE